MRSSAPTHFVTMALACVSLTALGSSLAGCADETAADTPASATTTTGSVGGTGGGGAAPAGGSGGTASTGGGGAAGGTAGSGGVGDASITVVGTRFHRGGQPFFPVGNFLTGQNDAGPRTHVYLSDQVPAPERQQMLSNAQAQGYNIFSIYTYNEGDYGGVALSPFASPGFGGAFDDGKLTLWRQQVEAILAVGLHPVIWLVPDDSPGIHAASDAQLESYFAKMVETFDDLPVLWVMALEVDEYWNVARCITLGNSLAALTDRPVSVHQLSGQHSCMSQPWTDFGSFQYGFGKSWQQIFDQTLQVAAVLADKPLIGFEYDLSGGDNDERLGLAAAFGGAAGVGNGGPTGLDAFVASLPDALVSTRSDTHAYLEGGGVSATADMAALSFWKD